jgi:poly(A) polymerase
VSSTDSEPLSRDVRQALAELLDSVPAITDLGHRFGAAGMEIALVGGSVRDLLLARIGNDLDFTTSARPEQVRDLLDGWADQVWETGIAFGTIGARKGDHTLELTTYRSDVYEASSRKPAVSYGDTLVGDLLRRDFTVNAMAITLPDLGFVDPHGGLDDLRHGRLRTPAPPEESFGDDPLRMLRAARFTAQLGLGVTPDVRSAMSAMAERLSIVSAERVQAELVKLMLSPDPRRGLELMTDTGIEDLVLPELGLLRLEVDEHHRHKDVYQHTLSVLDRAIDQEDGPDGAVPGPDFVLRFAALMHDVGKPKTRRFEPDGRVSFHHHEVVGAKITRRRMQALRFSAKVTDDVSALVELHLRFHGYGGGEWTDSAVRRYVRDAGALLDRLNKLTRADCTTRNARRAQELDRQVDDLEERILQLKAQEDLDAIRPDLDGDRIMNVLGIGPGPMVGRAYRHLMKLRLDRGPLGEVEAVRELLDWWRDGDPPAED